MNFRTGVFDVPTVNIEGNAQRKLVSFWMLAGLLVVFVIGLFLLFPRNFVLGDGSNPLTNDAVMMKYLDNMVSKNPENIEMRLNLAVQLFAMGDYGEAIVKLKPVPHFPAEIDATSNTVAGELAEYFATRFPAEKNKWLREAAKSYLSVSRPDLAALTYIDALKNSEAPSERVELLEKAQRAWLSADRPEQALLLSQEFLSLALSTPGMTSLALEVGLANGDQGLIRAAAYRLLKSNPDDTEMLERLIELELGNGFLLEALVLAQKLQTIEPNNIANRRRLAQLNLWTGQPQNALGHLLWLSKNDAEFEMSDETWQLANSLYQYDTASQVLTALGRNRELTDEQLNALVNAYEESGKPRQAIDILKGYTRKNPGRWLSWKRLVDLQDNIEQWQSSVATWRKIESNFNVKPAEYVRWAKTLWRLNKPEVALSVLQHSPKANSSRSLEFWQLKARLEWDLERDSEAFSSYLQVNKLSPEPTQEMANRLLDLSVALGEMDTGLMVADQAWRTFRQPKYLLRAMDFAAQSKAWPRFGALLNEAQQSHSPYFEKSAQFWMLNAQYQDVSGRPKLALKSYRRALQLSPGLTEAEAAMLWLAIDRGDVASIRQQMAALQHAGEHKPALWAPLAAAYTQLGQTRQALPYLHRLVNANPDSNDWLLGYADALERVGYTAQATKTRQYALKKLLDRAQKSQLESASEWQQTLYLVRTALGAAPGEAMWRQIAQKLSPEQMAQWQYWIPHRIDQLLSRGEMDAAARWALEAQRQRLTLPVWQRVALAVLQNNADEMEKLLPQIPQQSVLDKARVLEQLQRKPEALLFALDNLNDSNDEWIRDVLRQQSVGLSSEFKNGYRVGWHLDDLGNIETRGPQFDYWHSANRYQFHVEGASKRFNEDAALFDLSDLGQETTLGLTARRKGRFGTDYFSVATSQRSDSNLTSLQWQHDLRVSDRLSTVFELSLRDQPDITPELRVFGREDSLKIRLNYLLSQRHIFNANVGWHSYESRQGSDIGSGPRLVLEYDYLFKFSGPHTSFWTRLDWIKNDLSPNLPPELAAFLKPGNAGLGNEALLPSRYGHLATGIRLQKGARGNSLRLIDSPTWFVDAGVGAQWPDRQFDFFLAAGQGWRLLGRDELSWSLIYNKQTIGSNEPSMSFNINYSQSLTK